MQINNCEQQFRAQRTDESLKHSSQQNHKRTRRNDQNRPRRRRQEVFRRNRSDESANEYYSQEHTRPQSRIGFPKRASSVEKNFDGEGIKSILV